MKLPEIIWISAAQPVDVKNLELPRVASSLPGIILGNFAIFTSPIYIGSLMDSLGYSERQAGFTSTLEIGTVAITCILLSGVLQRLPLKNTTQMGIGLILGANFLTCWVDSFSAVAMTRIMAGAGAGLCLAVAGAMISKAADPDRLVGTLLAINTLIMVLVLMLLGWVKSLWMFNGYLVLYALLALVCITLTNHITRHSATITHSITSRATPGNLAIGLLGISAFALFCVIEGGVWSFSERSGIQLGFSDTQIGLLLGLAQLAGLSGAVMASIYGARIKRIYPIITGIAAMGVAGFTIYQTNAQIAYGVSLGLFLFGFFFAFPYLLGAFALLDANGRWVARANGANLLGGAIAPVIAGGIVQASSFASLGVFLILTAAVTGILALLFAVKLNALSRNNYVVTSSTG